MKKAETEAKKGIENAKREAVGAIDAGVAANRITAMKVKDEIARMKYTPNPDFPKRYEELVRSIDRRFESLRNQR
jgi:hypothetical protein